jgi:hypothetical protein
MSDNGTSATQVRNLLRQQAAVAHFGSFALRESDVLKVLTEAARVCAQCLSVPFSKVCRYRETENDLLIEAGHGWHAGGRRGRRHFQSHVKIPVERVVLAS